MVIVPHKNISSDRVGHFLHSVVALVPGTQHTVGVLKAFAKEQWEEVTITQTIC